MTKKEIIALNLERYEILLKIQRAEDPKAETERYLEAIKADLEARGISVKDL
ncbi:MAG: hypothetical protein LIO44_07190 [Eubacterium sp.]|nr:hypothetical protein [Eubacterium sp.]